jgi:hypothetical protein
MTIFVSSITTVTYIPTIAMIIFVTEFDRFTRTSQKCFTADISYLVLSKCHSTLRKDVKASQHALKQ